MGRALTAEDIYDEMIKLQDRAKRLESARSIPALIYPFRANSSGTTSIPGTGVVTKTSYAAEIFDIEGVYDAANSRYVVPVDGVYSFAISMRLLTPGAVGTRWVWFLMVNGSDSYSIGIDWTLSTWSNDYKFYGSIEEVLLNAGDHVEVGVQQNSGGALSVSDTTSSFSGELDCLV